MLSYRLRIACVVLAVLLTACDGTAVPPTVMPDGPTGVPVTARPPTRTPKAVPAPVVPATFTEAECPFEADLDEEVPGARCGYLRVPQDRTKPDGLMLDLAVAIIPSDSKHPEPDPIVYLAGGPGQSAVDGIESWLGYSMLEEREIILFDQRGTGYSRPSLNCAELEEDSEWYEDYETTADAVRACYTRLKDEGIDLSQYNSAASAADVNDLRIALGYEQWNVLGVSYGTRLALALMRDYPTGIRSVILDSVYPPEVDAYNEEPLNVVRSFKVLFDACAADRACNKNYPNLNLKFYKLVDTLNAEPIETASGELTGDDLINEFFSAFYNAEMFPDMPRVIFSLADGDSSVYDAWGSEEEGLWRQGPEDGEGDTSDSEGLYYSVECKEEIPFNDMAEAERKLKDAARALREPLLAGTQELFDMCKIWKTGKTDPREDLAVVSDIPTLLLTGEYDPTTPPAWAFDAAQTLSQSYVFVLPGLGHSVLDYGTCSGILADAFLAKPTKMPSGSCVKKMPAVKFTPPDGRWRAPLGRAGAIS